VSELLILILSLLGGRAHVVEHGHPTGDLRRGDVIVELGTNTDECNDAGGTPLGTVCIGLDF